MKLFYLGCDVSKGYADFVIINEKKESVEENFQLDDTSEGHQQLIIRLDRFFENHPNSTLCAAVESTGGYEKNRYHKLLVLQDRFSLRAARINPIGIAHDSKAGMKRNLTDKISALNIAEYMIRHPEKIRYGQEDPTSSLKKMWGFLKMLKKQQGELGNQLESLLYAGNPEILRYCRVGVPQWVLKLLKKYPTALKLSKARPSTVASIPFVSLERAKELVKQAKLSTACESDPVSAHLTASTVEQLIHLGKTLKVQEKQFEKMCDWPEVDLLTSINGVGKVTAIVLMLYIQDISRFDSAKKLASFFGVHPEYKVSGDGTKKGSFRMSKKGQKDPRALLYMGAMSSLKSNPLINDLYKSKKASGMNGKAAICVCIHKLIRIAYGILKSGIPFDPAIDERNRQNSLKPDEKVMTDKSRRFQGFDNKAPISRRQMKKRMEHLQPKGVNPRKQAEDAIILESSSVELG